MSDALLTQVAEAAGIAPHWRDAFGATHAVTPETLRQVLQALDYPADSDAQLADSLLRAQRVPAAPPPLITAVLGDPVIVPCLPAPYALLLDDGRRFGGYAEPCANGAVIPPILEAGYHSLEIGGAHTVVAVAPRACPTMAQALSGGRAFGVAAQLYSLRRNGDGGAGDFQALAELARDAAGHGAQCVAISPVHAQFSADPDRYTPYAPSSRVALNVLHCAIDDTDADWLRQTATAEIASLIDWPSVARARLAGLRAMFAAARNDTAVMAAFAAFRATTGAALEQHAVFEALHAHFVTIGPEFWHWRSWPAPFRDPDSPAVQDFVGAHRDDVDFHAFAQYLADRGLARAQSAAREAGMAIGLISDLAVGVDSGGSQCWGSPLEMLTGVTVGAPPDLLQRAGQNWGLTALSPSGLKTSGYVAFQNMLRAALAHAGGVRIDHSMGFHRLWVVPDGAMATQGAYLRFPETDMLRLVALEAERRQAVVIAEDLGTLPEGFQHRLQQAGISGMRVLYFERDQSGHFLPPGQWTRQAAALTTTHDLPTIAGWWRGHDIDLAAGLGLVADPLDDHAHRAADRDALWQAMCASGAAQGDKPAADQPDTVVEAAIRHSASSACDLLIVPMEDVLGLPDQPNLPGTFMEHPNWRRRLPGDAASLLQAPKAAARLRAAASAGRDAVKGP